MLCICFREVYIRGWISIIFEFFFGRVGVRICFDKVEGRKEGEGFISRIDFVRSF